MEVSFFGNSCENKTANINVRAKLANLSDIPLGSAKKFFQIIADAVPPIREAKTPAMENRFQNKSNN